MQTQIDLMSVIMVSAENRKGESNIFYSFKFNLRVFSIIEKIFDTFAKSTIFTVAYRKNNKS